MAPHLRGHPYPRPADTLVNDRDAAALHPRQQCRGPGIPGQPLQIGAGQTGDVPGGGNTAAPLKQLRSQVVSAIALLPDAAVGAQGGQQRVNGAFGITGGLIQLPQRHGRLLVAENVQQLQGLDKRLDLSFFSLFHGIFTPVSFHFFMPVCRYSRPWITRCKNKAPRIPYPLQDANAMTGIAVSQPYRQSGSATFTVL